MVGVAESYLGAFAVELGHGPHAQGLLATLPLVAGALCQLASPLFCSWVGGRKRAAIAGALGQAASMAALVAIAAVHTSSFSALLAAKVLFWVAGGLMAPAWNAWMADLTLHTDRPRYFAVRSAINQVALLLAFCGAGWALQEAGLRLMHCYVVLFAVAFAARLISAGALVLQAEVGVSAPPARRTSILPRLQNALGSARFRIPLYLALLAFGTQISAPFFTQYMLRDLGLDYRSYAALSALSILAKALAFPCSHHLAERFGQRCVLRWGGVGVALIPTVWAVSSDLPALIVAHVLGGAVWAAVEYASFQLLLDSAPSRLTAEFFSLSNAVTGVAQVAGALFGGLLLGVPQLGYEGLFVLSALLRAAPLALLFLALHPAQLPGQLRWVYARLRSLEALASSGERALLRASEVPRALGNRTTDPPPAL
ncbi:MAG TPA: MFS transporter [Polyangiaceae bacterium]|nr:MFS transporter [Polyangiaceae bacterium]